MRRQEGSRHAAASSAAARTEQINKVHAESERRLSKGNRKPEVLQQNKLEKILQD